MIQGCFNICDDDYHNGSFSDVPLLSRSIIKELLKCPAKAFEAHPKLNQGWEPEEKAAFDLGGAAHDLLLRGLDNVFVIDADSWRSKEAREARDVARAVGKYPLLTDKYKEVKDMVVAAEKALYSQPELKITNLLAEGDSELTYVWEQDEAWMCSRLDWISKDRRQIIDYKTVGRSAYPEDFKGSIVDHGYDIQSVLYRQAVSAVDGVKAKFVFMVQETAPPYLCTFIDLDMMFCDMAEQKIEKGIRVWNQCLKGGVWPGYSDKIYTVEPQPWSLASWEMKKSEWEGEEGWVTNLKRELGKA